MINGPLLFITGIAVFLFAMLKLSALMQQLLSARIREYILLSVKRPVYGLLMGITTTILFQSSSASTLLTIGLVSAGLITFYQSLGIILGADIGTTLTVQLVVWNVTSLAPIIILAGATLLFLGKETGKQVGEALVYFGLIFLGLSLTGSAVAPLKESVTFAKYVQEAKYPLLGLLLGVVFTAIVHASAIPIGILAIMGQQGLITIENALPIILGANIGTTVTALIGSLSGNINGKRTAICHLLFKCAGAGIFLPALPLFIGLLRLLSLNVAQQVAFAHFMFNVLIAFIFIFLLRPISVVIEKVIPGMDETLPLWPEFLNRDRLSAPEDALLCVENELEREIALTERMLAGSLGLIYTFREGTKKDIMYIELVVDNLQAEITKYLWNISCAQLTPFAAKRLFASSTIVYEIERIGDRSTNIVELSESRHRRRAIFSEAAQREVTEIGSLVLTNLKETGLLIRERDKGAIQRVIQRTGEIEAFVKKATEQHLVRFYQKVCEAEAGPIFVDMLVNLERISFHCQTIAERLLGLDDA